MIRIGTSGWMYSHWKKKFYPSKLPQNKWFEYYTTKFLTVEINASYYRSFKDSDYQSWHNQAPDNFKYSIKAHRIITHRKHLLGNEILRCWSSATLLKSKLGLILLQLPENSFFDLDHLEKVILAFPEPKKLVIEFRHSKWLNNNTYAFLKTHQITFCYHDFDGIKVPNLLTSKNGYIRLHGPNSYTPDNLKFIKNLIQKQLSNGAQNIYVFFNNDAHGYAPINALQLTQLLTI